MEWSVLKSYREERYSAAVHPDAYSSEGSSYAQTSPEYDAAKYAGSGGPWGDPAGKLELIKQNLPKNSYDDGSDEAVEKGSSCEEDQEVDDFNEEDSQEEEPNVSEEQEVTVDSDDYDIVECSEENVDDESGPVIHIFAVDPELDLEYSSDEEAVEQNTNNGQDWSIANHEEHKVAEDNSNSETDDSGEYLQNHETADQMQKVLSVDEYFVKDNDNNSESSLSEDKDIIEEIQKSSGDCNAKDKIVDSTEIIAKHESTDFVERVLNIDEYFVKNKATPEKPSNETNNVLDPTNLPLIEPDLSALIPHIEEYKKLLLEDSPPKLGGKSFQKSFSLPHSPSHLPKADIEDARTSLSFEDLNISDLNDFSFDSDIRAANKMFDISELNDDADGDAIRTLNDDDVNSFLITKPKYAEEKTDNRLVKLELEDDLSQQDMEIECPVESNINTSISTNNTAQIKTSTPTSKTKPETLLNFCIEKSTPPKENLIEVKIETDDFVDVESLSEAIELPVLEANNVNSLLEQFEATEKFNNPNRKARRNIESSINVIPEKASDLKNETKNNGLMHGTRIQDAAILLNKNKMRQILMPTSSPNSAVAQIPIQENVHADHDYCSPTKRSGTHVPASVAHTSLIAPPRRRQSLLKPEVLSSNNLIKNSRHRTCKSKKIVYTLSSDDEDNIAKPKCNDKKEIAKDSLISNHRKKLSPTHSINNQVSAKLKCRSQISPAPVISSASDLKSSDKSSQSSSGSIKLTIKNKTKVILKLDSDENKESLKSVVQTERTKHELKTETDKRLKDVSKRVSENSLLKPLNKINETKVTPHDTKNTNINSIVKKEVPVIKETIPIKKQIPAVKKELKVMKREVPVIKKEYLVIKKEPPIIKKKMHVIKKEVSVVKREAPLISKEVTDVKNNISVIENYVPPLFYRNPDPLGLMVKDDSTDQPDDVQIHPEPTTPAEIIKVDVKQPPKKKLNLQEYRLRKEGVPSNSSSRTVSPEAVSIANQDIFTINTAPAVEDRSSPPQLSSTDTMQSTPSSTTTSNRSSPKHDNGDGKKIFDPIREASRKILMNSKKQKAEALRKRDEDIVMSKIPIVQNIELKPLISDVEMLQIVSLAAAEIEKQASPEPAKPSEYEEIIMVSVGINTDPIKLSKDTVIPSIENSTPVSKTKMKPGINFKIKKADQNSVLKQNVFDHKRHPNEDAKDHFKNKSPDHDNKTDNKIGSPSDKAITVNQTKIDKKRFKDITATLKRVEKNSDVKISSNSLFASIQDVVMKKAPETEKPEKKEQKTDERKRHRSENSEDGLPKSLLKKMKTIIVNECPKEEHGEDKVILHLPKVRVKPEANSVKVQTDLDGESEPKTILKVVPASVIVEEQKESEKTETVEIKSRKRVDSGKSTTSLGSNEDRSSHNKRSLSKGHSPKERLSKRSPSRERRWSRRRSYSRSRSRSRHRSRSHDLQRRSRYSSYRRRSRSPYRSLRSRSPTYRSRRSPSYKRNNYRRRYCRSRSQSRHETPVRETRKHSRSPVYKKKILTPEKSGTPPPKRVSRTPEPAKKIGNILSPKKCVSPSMTPPLRKPTISESSSSSTSSSSSSGSSSSGGSGSRSGHSCYTPSPAHSPPRYRARLYSRSSSEDGRTACIPPVEERRIVYVGKLETDITKQAFRALFVRFGPITEVTLHTKDNGCKYGFVTFRNGRDAWSAVETARSAAALARYDVGFGGRRAFCRQRYADLDGLEAEYSESSYMGLEPPPVIPTQDVSFDVLLQEMKNKLKNKKEVKV